MPQTGLKSGSEALARRPANFHGRAPTKPDINFALVGVKHVRWWLLLLAIVLIAAAVACFAKFLVLDKLAEVTAAEHEAANARRAVAECNARIEAYGELNDIYAHYTYSGMTEEELGRVDRTDVMDLLERVVFPRTHITEWALTGNQLSLTIEGSTLQEINETVQQLQEEDIVSFCEVHAATTDGITLYYGTSDPLDKVTASIVIYMHREEAAEE